MVAHDNLSNYEGPNPPDHCDRVSLSFSFPSPSAWVVVSYSSVQKVRF